MEGKNDQKEIYKNNKKGIRYNKTKMQYVMMSILCEVQSFAI